MMTNTPSGLNAHVAAWFKSHLGRLGLTALLVAALTSMLVIYNANYGSSASTSTGSGPYVYSVGQPGPGAQAIDFTLPSTSAKQVSLASFRGKTVLTYWSEGLGCQPCWDQIHAIEADMPALKAAGVDAFVSVTSGPVDLLRQKMSDDNLHSMMLADTDLAVSTQYQMNMFGMMGSSRDGHTFMLIGPDGKILWRADYGGAPNYTMFVPVQTVLAQMKAGRIK